MRFFVAIEIEDSTPIKQAKDIALAVAFQLNAIGRNNSNVKIDLDPFQTQKEKK